MTFSRHCPLLAFSRWRFRLTRFGWNDAQGTFHRNGNFLWEVGPFWVDHVKERDGGS